MAPFNLDTGVLLEDTNLLIPWHAQKDELHEFGSPETLVDTDRTQIIWRDHQCLDGLQCDVSALFFSPPEEQDKVEGIKVAPVLPLFLHGILFGKDDLIDEIYGDRFITASFHTYAYGPKISPKEEYERINTHLFPILGKPSRELQTGGHKWHWPITEWDYDTVQITNMIYDKMGPVPSLKIVRKNRR